MIKKLYLCVLIFFLLLHNVIANEQEIPRFVTIKFNEVNARTGPEKKCPIEWVFISKGEPVEVIAEYDQWRKIRDIKGEGGWVHQSVISAHRSVIITSKKNVDLLKYPSKYDNIIAKLEPQLRCKLIKCKHDWCLINCNERKGWVTKKYLWGVYPEE